MGLKEQSRTDPLDLEQVLGINHWLSKGLMSSLDVGQPAVLGFFGVTDVNTVALSSRAMGAGPCCLCTAHDAALLVSPLGHHSLAVVGNEFAVECTSLVRYHDLRRRHVETNA